MARDRVVYGTVTANGASGISLEVEGAVYGPGVPSLDPDLAPGDQVPTGFLNPRSSRQPLILAQRPRLLEFPESMFNPVNPAITGNGLWLMAEAFCSIAYGLGVPVTPLAFSGNSGNMVAILSLNRSATEAGLAGSIDPRGIVVTSPRNSSNVQFGVAAVYYQPADRACGYITEALLSGDAQGQLLADTLAFPAPEAAGFSSERRQGYLFADADAGIYTVTAETGIYAVMRNSPPGVWSPWAANVEEETGSGAIYRMMHAGSCGCVKRFLIEGAFPEWILNNGNATSHAAIQVYVRDESLIYQPTGLASLSTVAASNRIFGCGGTDAMAGRDVGLPSNMPSTRWPFREGSDEWWIWFCGWTTGNLPFFRIAAIGAAAGGIIPKGGLNLPATPQYLLIHPNIVTEENARLGAGKSRISDFYHLEEGNPVFNEGVSVEEHISHPSSCTYTDSEGHSAVGGEYPQTYYRLNLEVFAPYTLEAPDLKYSEYFGYPFLGDWDDESMPTAQVLSGGYLTSPVYPMRAPSGVIADSTHYTVAVEPHLMVTSLGVQANLQDKPMVSGPSFRTYAYVLKDTVYHYLYPNSYEHTTTVDYSVSADNGAAIIPLNCLGTPGNIPLTTAPNPVMSGLNFGVDNNLRAYEWIYYQQQVSGIGLRWTIGAYTAKVYPVARRVYKTYLLATTASGTQTKTDITQYCSWSGGASGTALPKATAYPYTGSVWQLAVAGDYLWIIRQRPWTLSDAGVLPGRSADLGKREPFLELRLRKDMSLIGRLNLHPPTDLPGRAMVPDYDHPPHMLVGIGPGTSPWACVFGTWRLATGPSAETARHARTTVTIGPDGLARVDALEVGIKPASAPSSLEARTLALGANGVPIWINDGSTLVKGV